MDTPIRKRSDDEVSMEITVYRRVNVTHLTSDRVENIRTYNGLLEPHEHAPDCPVRYGASADCVWPLAVCIAEPISNVYNIDHGPTRCPSPSDAPPALRQPQWVGSICGHRADVGVGEEAYVIGDSEPCIHCNNLDCVAVVEAAP